MNQEQLEKVLTYIGDIISGDGGKYRAVVDRARERLKMGAEQYGEDDYLTKDCLAEAMQETADIIAYLALEMLKDPQISSHLNLACIHASLADHHLQQMMKHRAPIPRAPVTMPAPSNLPHVSPGGEMK